MKYLRILEEKNEEREEGREEALRESAKRMLRKGCLSHAEIAEYTGLTETEVRELEKETLLNT